MNLLSQFLKYNKRKHLFEPGDHLLLAVSGGIDSMVLLHLLLQVQQRFHLKLSLAHYNHRLRGQESDADQEFVELAAKAHGLACYVSSGNVILYASEKKISIEMAARECRYHFLSQTAEAIHADRLMTAHNANDQAETILQHFLRGSGVRGMSGMSPRKGILARPLLFAPRKEIEGYAQRQNITFREDSSNAEPDYQRNHIRLNLLPMLESEYNPSMVRTLNRIGENYRELDEYLVAESEKALILCLKQKNKNKIILDISKYYAYFNLLKKYILRAAIKELGIDPNVLTFELYDQIEAHLAKKRAKSAIHIKGETILCASSSEVYIGPPFERLELVKIDKIPASYRLSTGRIFEINRDRKPLIQELKAAVTTEEWIDAGQLQQPVMIRPVQEGDYFYPINFRGRKKVSDFLTDLQVPYYDRAKIPVLVSGDKIVWIGGFRLDNRFKITKKSTDVLHIVLRN